MIFFLWKGKEKKKKKKKKRRVYINTFVWINTIISDISERLFFYYYFSNVFVIQNCPWHVSSRWWDCWGIFVFLYGEVWEDPKEGSRGMLIMVDWWLHVNCFFQLWGTFLPPNIFIIFFLNITKWVYTWQWHFWIIDICIPPSIF